MSRRRAHPENQAGQARRIDPGSRRPDPHRHRVGPSDGQFDPKTPVELTGTNYLTLAGTYDANVSTFAGARQYARTDVSPNLVKAAVSIGRANHTQFNPNGTGTTSGEKTDLDAVVKERPAITPSTTESRSRIPNQRDRDVGRWLPRDRFWSP